MSFNNRRLKRIWQRALNTRRLQRSLRRSRWLIQMRALCEIYVFLGGVGVRCLLANVIWVVIIKNALIVLALGFKIAVAIICEQSIGRHGCSLFPLWLKQYSIQTPLVADRREREKMGEVGYKYKNQKLERIVIKARFNLIIKLVWGTGFVVGRTWKGLFLDPRRHLWWKTWGRSIMAEEDAQPMYVRGEYEPRREAESSKMLNTI